MKIEDILSHERQARRAAERARLAAEQALAQKQTELAMANDLLSKHALSLSEEIHETRVVVDVIKNEKSQALADLEKANAEVMIAKRRLWVSLETIEGGFAVFDKDNKLVVANSAYLSQFDGLTSVSAGISYFELLLHYTNEGIVNTGDMSASQWRAMMTHRWQGETHEPIVINLWDGSHIKLVDRRSQDGDMVSLVLDITDSISYQAELGAARKKAEEANRAKSSFLANMSHEIRTPMNGVISMAELMAEGELDDEQRLYVDTIRKSSHALLTILNDVLDYSKMEAANLTLQLETFDLERIVLDVVTLLQPSAQEKGLQLILDFDLFLPSKLTGDMVRIRQILTNLVGNAIKFTTYGHVLVRAIGVPSDQTHAQKIHITVEDSGIGIPEHMQSQIFGKFNQVDNNRNRKYDGAGLGLAITHQLVQLMEGDIWIESQEGTGSTFGFHITLPIVEAVSLPLAPKNKNVVLFAIEDKLNRNILEKQFSAAGLKVIYFDPNVPHLMQLSSAQVIIVDSQYGGACRTQNATSFVDYIHSLNPSIPIYLMAGMQSSSSKNSNDVKIAKRVFNPPLIRENVFEIIKEIGAQSLQPIHVANDNLPTQTTDIKTQAPQSLRKMRILAAEDNKTNQLVFRKMLKSVDADLQFANNGREAIEAFEIFKPDLIFMDISMPEVDGREATQHIRKLEQDQELKRTRIVALTAHALIGDDQEIMSYGLDEYMSKPLKKADLLAEIASNCPKEALDPITPPEVKT